MKKVLICGAAGFVGWHLAKRLKQDGCYVVGVDRKQPEFAPFPGDELFTTDLRSLKENDWLFANVTECYQLACEVGGLGYIMDHDNDAAMLRNSALINLRVLEACRFQKIPKVFFASSACVYSSLPTVLKDSGGGKKQQYVARTHRACRESDVPPADPDNSYAWEKVFSEQLYKAYAHNYGMQARIARFHNCYGPQGTWQGGREKAPAAICRKVAEARSGDAIEVWGDGNQTRSFMFIDDAIEGVVRLMASDFQGPLNIGSSEMVTVNQLVQMVTDIAGKRLTTHHIEGPVGVRGRNSDNRLIEQKLHWQPSIPLRKGLEQIYAWVKEQVQNGK